MKFGHYLASLLLVALASASTFGGSIGINIVGLDPGTQTLEPDEKAGVLAVAQDHWNNVSISKDDPNGHNNGGKLDTLINSDGKNIKGATVVLDASPTCQIFPASAAPWGFTGNDLKLQSGEAFPQARVTVKGVPYKHYAVYVYLTAGNNGGQGSATITVANGTKGKVDANKTYFYNYNWQEGNYVQSKSRTLEEAKSSSGSNCICFTDNTASDFTVECDGKLGGGWTGAAAIQVVELP